MVVLFADFNCPYSYAICERLLALGARPDWRGVEHAPRLAIPAAVAPQRVAFEREVAEVRSLAPEVTLNQPRALPNTRFALVAAAKAARLDADAAAEFRTGIFRALWIDGRDISEQAELDEIARAVGLPPGPTGRPFHGRTHKSPVGGVPAIVGDRGWVLKGLVSTAQLREFLVGHLTHDVQGAW